MNYHLDYSRVSKTMLNHFAKSTKDFERYYVSREAFPPRPKRQMIIGSAVHKILLERSTPAECCLVYPDNCFKKNGAINPVPSRKFIAENPDKFVLKQTDLDMVNAACAAAYDHELAAILQAEGVVFEQPQYWTDEETGIDCRLMADFFLDMGDYILVYDLKTTEDINPAAVRRTCKMFRYWLQDAHYSSGFEHLFGKPVQFRFWFIEVGGAFRIAPWEYSPTSRDIAKKTYRDLMAQLKRCRMSGDFEDSWTQSVNFLELSPWEVDEPVDEEVAYVNED